MKYNLQEKLAIFSLSFLCFGMVICFFVLSVRITGLENKASELQNQVEKQEQMIEKIEEKNKMQDVILNKLNTKYNYDVSEELQEIADQNGVGG